MGKARFNYNNYITSSSMITASSTKAGFPSTPVKFGSGSSTMNISGDFTGTENMRYIVEIDSVSSGYEIGQSTFKVTRQDSNGNTILSTGTVTSTSPIAVENGISIFFVTGSGNDFELADRWSFVCETRFGVGNLLIFDRDKRYRSNILESPNTLVINFGTAKEIQCLAIFDHNLTSGATITWEVNNSNSWITPAGTYSITYNANKILYYPTSIPNYQYTRLAITDTSNPDNYIEIGKLYLGPYLELTKNFVVPYSRPLSFITDSISNAYGRDDDTYYNQRQQFDLDYKNMPNADVASVKSMFTSLLNKTTKQYKGFFFNIDSDTPNEYWMVKHDPKLGFLHNIDYYTNNNFNLKLFEILSTRE